MHGSGRAWARTNAGARVLDAGAGRTTQGGEEFRHLLHVVIYMPKREVGNGRWRSSTSSCWSSVGAQQTTGLGGEDGRTSLRGGMVIFQGHNRA
eukprot:2279792-Prymnesium_polylepis.1